MSAEREDAAKVIYATIQELMPLGKNYPWIEGGNSLAQDTARRAAAKLPLLTPEQAAVIAAANRYVLDESVFTSETFAALIEAVTILRAQEGA